MRILLLITLAMLLVSCVPSRRITYGGVIPLEGETVKNIHHVFDLDAYQMDSNVVDRSEEIELDVKLAYVATIDFRFEMDKELDYFQVLAVDEKVSNTKNGKSYLAPILLGGVAQFKSQFTIIDDETLAVLYTNVDFNIKYRLVPGKSYILRISTKILKATSYTVNVVTWSGPEKEMPMLAYLCESELSSSLVSIPRGVSPTFFLENGNFFLNPDKNVLCGKSIPAGATPKCTYVTESVSIPPSSSCAYATGTSNFNVSVDFLKSSNHAFYGSIVCKENGSIFNQVKFIACVEKIFDREVYFE